MLGQAISWKRASQSGQYQPTQQADAQPQFDAARIQEFLAAIITEYARWEMFFTRNGIEPVRLRYEEIVAEPQAAVDRVATLFDLAGAATADMRRIDVTVQRDAQSEAWRQRFSPCNEARISSIASNS